MDGLLLDTEPLWGESMMRVAAKHQIPVSNAQFKETTGLRIYEVTEHWSIHYPWEGLHHREVAEEILDDIILASKERGRVLNGVEQSLQTLKALGYKIGLASSSPARMIEALINHFNLNKYFDCITSADEVELGKPHPAVFLTCAAHLGSLPRQCLVLEDSVNGMIAAKAARMKVVMVPEDINWDDPRFSLADGKLRSLEYFDIHHYE